MLILGIGFGILCLQRGAFLLHANNIAVDDDAVAFVGDSGAGKSTLAAACDSQGYSPVSDDLSVLDLRGEHPTVRPGFPYLKLDSTTGPRLLPDRPTSQESNWRGKRYYPTRSDTPDSERPLRAIYVLADGPEVGIEPIRPQTAIWETIKHTGISGFYEKTGQLETHLAEVGRLLDAVPVRRLQRPQNLEILPEIVETITGDVSSIATSDGSVSVG